jgi:hypothetical protein
LSAGGHWARDLDVNQLAGCVQQNSSHNRVSSDWLSSLHWSSHTPRELYEQHPSAVKQYS